MSDLSHKTMIERFAEAVSDRQVNHLDQFLENDIQKTTNEAIIYKNIQEAQDYYRKENSTQWKILEFVQDDPNGNTMQTRVSHGDKIYKTSYTFGSSGKIHRIDTVIENH